MSYFKNVVKRNGITVPFDEKKIENAVAKAFVATGEVEARDVSAMSRAITLMVVTGLRETAEEIPTVEEIQDKVEEALMKCDYAKTAKAYILYRNQHQKARNTKNTLLDYKKLVNGYIGEEKDWRVKENSTVTLSVGGLILSNSGAITANYWLSEVYDEEIAEAHRRCFKHADRLLRRLELKTTPGRRAGRRAGSHHLGAGQTPQYSLQPDGKLFGHHAERMGRRAGVFFL